MPQKRTFPSCNRTSPAGHFSRYRKEKDGLKLLLVFELLRLRGQLRAQPSKVMHEQSRIGIAHTPERHHDVTLRKFCRQCLHEDTGLRPDRAGQLHGISAVHSTARAGLVAT